MSLHIIAAGGEVNWRTVLGVLTLKALGLQTPAPYTHSRHFHTHTTAIPATPPTINTARHKRRSACE